MTEQLKPLRLFYALEDIFDEYHGQWTFKGDVKCLRDPDDRWALVKVAEERVGQRRENELAYWRDRALGAEAEVEKLMGASVKLVKDKP